MSTAASRRLLAPHFALAEFCVSASHPQLVDHDPPGAVVARLERLARDVLEPLRQDLGRPIRILSGYRSPRLNDAVGGSPTSQHVRGEAADLQVAGLTPRALLAHCLTRVPLLRTGQVIAYPDRGFVHVALPGRTYPTPSFHVHWPARDLVYRPIAGASQLDALLPALPAA